jgi:hypothetical protein
MSVYVSVAYFLFQDIKIPPNLPLVIPTNANDPDNDIHIVFSTGFIGNQFCNKLTTFSRCNLFQAWQAEVLLHSAHSVGQKGAITRIVSGCEEKEVLSGATNVKIERLID